MMMTRTTSHLRRALAISAVILTAGLTGCQATDGSSAAPTSDPSTRATPSSSPAPSASPAPTETAVPSPTEAAEADEAAEAPSAPAATSITLDIDGRQITGELDDSATAASLIAQLPLTLSFHDFGGQEKEADLPAPLSLDGAPDRSGADPLTIGYYSPQQRLILYYAPVGSFAGIVPIGSFDDLAAVRDQSGDFTVTISRAG